MIFSFGRVRDWGDRPRESLSEAERERVRRRSAVPGCKPETDGARKGYARQCQILRYDSRLSPGPPKGFRQQFAAGRPRERPRTKFICNRLRQTSSFVADAHSGPAASAEPAGKLLPNRRAPIGIGNESPRTDEPDLRLEAAATGPRSRPVVAPANRPAARPVDRCVRRGATG